MLLFVIQIITQISHFGMFSYLVAKIACLVFGHFKPIFGQKIDPKPPRGPFNPKRIHQKEISDLNSNFEQN